MAVTTETSLVSHNGNDSTVTPYAVGFYFLHDADLRVVVTDEDGEATTLVLDTDYTVTGAGEEEGGSLVTTVAVPEESTVTIYREMKATQNTSYLENDTFPAASHERSLDKLTMLSQQALAEARRAFRVDRRADELAPFRPTFPSVLSLNGSGQPVSLAPAELAVFLNLTQRVFEMGTVTWLDATYRGAAIPDFLGQIGVQIDDGSVWISDGVTPGDWTSAVGGIADGAITTAMLNAGLLSADASGLAKMADGYLSADTAGRAKMANQFVTLAKIINATTHNRLLGRSTSGAGTWEEITVGSGLSLNSGTLTASAAGAATGAILQTVYTSNNTAAGFTRTYSISVVPQIGDGTQVCTITITPVSTANRIRLRAMIPQVGCNDTLTAMAAIFKVGQSNAIASTATYVSTAQGGGPIVIECEDSPATTSAVTYSLQVGPNGHTLYLGRRGPTNVHLGNSILTTLVAEEIKG